MRNSQCLLQPVYLTLKPGMFHSAKNQTNFLMLFLKDQLSSEHTYLRCILS